MDRHAWIDEQLAQVPMFRGLSKKQLREISQLMTRVDRPAGTVLTEEGAAGREFIIVLEGDLEVRHDDQVVAKLGPGDYFGEIALLDDRPRTATVVARTPVSIEVLSRAEFSSLLTRVPDLSTQMLASVAQRLAELEGQTRP